MKIVVAALTAPTAMNGVSRHAVNLVTALLQSDSISDVHFICGSWQKEMFRHAFREDNPRVHTHFVELRGRGMSRLAWYYWELPHIAAQLEADVVHFACPVPLRAGAFRCATVVSLHDLYPFDLPENFGAVKSFVTRAIMARCVRNVEALACVSQSTRLSVQKWFPEQAPVAVTICNVVEPDRSLRIEAFGPISTGRTFLLCVAQHRANKNVALAVRILDSLIQNRILPRSSQLVVVGIPGPETQNIRDVVRHLKLEQNVLFLNGLADAELQWCYRHCKLLLAPSTTEGFGLPVAEAMLAGCPVVCSDIPAFREIGGEACHYVVAGSDPASLYANKISQVLPLPRPAPIPFPQLSARVVGRQYAELYAKLACCGVSDFWYATATRT
ncbi:MAG TPA: glycosyltransferase family 1 protein [Terracidiphilus sp.]